MKLWRREDGQGWLIARELRGPIFNPN